MGYAPFSRWLLRKERTDAVREQLVAWGGEVQLVLDEQLGSGTAVRSEADVVSIDIADSRHIRGKLAYQPVQFAVLICLAPSRGRRAEANVEDLRFGQSGVNYADEFREIHRDFSGGGRGHP
jgi:hypothetical protein